MLPLSLSSLFSLFSPHDAVADVEMLRRNYGSSFPFLWSFLLLPPLPYMPRILSLSILSLTFLDDVAAAKHRTPEMAAAAAKRSAFPRNATCCSLLSLSLQIYNPWLLACIVLVFPGRKVLIHPERQFAVLYGKKVQESSLDTALCTTLNKPSQQIYKYVCTANGLYAYETLKFVLPCL